MVTRKQPDGDRALKRPKAARVRLDIPDSNISTTRSGRSYTSPLEPAELQLQIQRLRAELEKATQRENQAAAQRGAAEQRAADVEAENFQLQNRQQDLEALVATLEAELKVRKAELCNYKLQVGRYTKQLEDEKRKWARANAVRRAAKESRVKAGKAAMLGAASTTPTAAVDKDADRKAETLSTLSVAGDGNNVAGTKILQAFLNNTVVKEMLDRLMVQSDHAPGAVGSLQTDIRMVDRLVESVTMLKNSTASLTEW